MQDVIFVYGKNNCGQCEMIKKKLIDKNVNFNYICDEEITITKAKELQEKNKLVEMIMPIIIKNNEQIKHNELLSVIN